MAPFFTEIDENIEYVEREDEFEAEISDEDITYKLLSEDEKKKRKLAKNVIDIETISPDHLCTYAQVNGLNLNSQNKTLGFGQVTSNIPVQVSSQDTYGLLAR